MFDAVRQAGAEEVLQLAKEIAQVISAHGPRKIRVEGWNGHSGGTWEVGIEIDGSPCHFAVDDEDLLRFPGDSSTRTSVANRIRERMGKCLDAD